MASHQYALSWDSFQSSICNGFSSLQQNGEFVDMTLAADGHVVKVHQAIIALSSSYLKNLITSAPCQHPVIFLNNVSYKTLSSLLEYMYTGEAIVPADNFNNFVNTAKALHIKGLENVLPTKEVVPQQSYTDTSDVATEKPIFHVNTTGTDIPQIDVELPSLRREVHIKRERTGNITVSSAKKEESFDMSSTFDDTHFGDTSDNELETQPVNTVPEEMQKMPATSLQFTVSNRGSLQVILNRYLYNLHSTAHKTAMRRWRCVDYRNKRCPAYIITKGNIVLNRCNLHNHQFHDKKIISKIERKSVYSAIDEIPEGDKQEDQIKTVDISMEDE